MRLKCFGCTKLCQGLRAGSFPARRSVRLGNLNPHGEEEVCKTSGKEFDFLSSLFLLRGQAGPALVS